MAAASAVVPGRWVEHVLPDQLDVVRRHRLRLARALLLGLGHEWDRVAADLLVAFGALEDRRSTVSVLMIVGSPTPSFRSSVTHASIGPGRRWRSWWSPHFGMMRRSSCTP